ncbi:hypothetical protein E1I69_12995 [Bacillus timonensis]|uniref:Nucleotidyltransferase family protein n=1 Tax=Bacillus timonensis TaxID=1033734 RepID=A0A4S3PRL7_9BACI|nr:hypothetical protein [Bacillus timonensis]THE11925.1 hypothetical protein E1I69_12995 [Bacillus timonensis]
MIETLREIVATVGERKIIWGVGGSLLLSFHGLVQHPNDIDLLVNEEDALWFNKKLELLGTSLEAKSLRPFRTSYFAKFRVGGFNVDSMGGFAIEHEEGVYRLPFDENSVVGRVEGIPLCSLEDWYILYMLIPNRQDKAARIEEHFNKNGVKHPMLLARALNQPLPHEIKAKVEKLLW